MHLTIDIYNYNYTMSELRLRFVCVVVVVVVVVVDVVESITFIIKVSHINCLSPVSTNMVPIFRGSLLKTLASREKLHELVAVNNQGKIQVNFDSEKESSSF